MYIANVSRFKHYRISDCVETDLAKLLRPDIVPEPTLRQKYQFSPPCVTPPEFLIHHINLNQSVSRHSAQLWSRYRIDFRPPRIHSVEPCLFPRRDFFRRFPSPASDRYSLKRDVGLLPEFSDTSPSSDRHPHLGTDSTEKYRSCGLCASFCRPERIVECRRREGHGRSRARVPNYVEWHGFSLDLGRRRINQPGQEETLAGQCRVERDQTLESPVVDGCES